MVPRYHRYLSLTEKKKPCSPCLNIVVVYFNMKGVEGADAGLYAGDGIGKLYVSCLRVGGKKSGKIIRLRGQDQLNVRKNIVISEPYKTPEPNFLVPDFSKG